MNTVLNILLLLILGVLAFQDFKQRAVSWIFLVVLFVLIVTKALLVLPLAVLGGYFAINAMILSLQFIGLIFYFKMKGYSFSDFWKQVMGAGDFLFLLCLCGAFAPFNFIVFILAGLAFTILGYIAMFVFRVRNAKAIPFAGLLAIFAILLVASCGKWEHMCYDNQAVLKFIRS
jgi:Flp pilus assembly protein protease CpaA